MATVNNIKELKTLVIDHDNAIKISRAIKTAIAEDYWIRLSLPGGVEFSADAKIRQILDKYYEERVLEAEETLNMVISHKEEK